MLLSVSARRLGLIRCGEYINGQGGTLARLEIKQNVAESGLVIPLSWSQRAVGQSWENTRNQQCRSLALIQNFKDSSLQVLIGHAT